MLNPVSKSLLCLLLAGGAAVARAETPVATGECRVPAANVAEAPADSPAATRLRAETDMFRAAFEVANAADACFDAAFVSLDAERAANRIDPKAAAARAAALMQGAAESRGAFDAALQRFEANRAMLSAEIAAGVEPAAGGNGPGFDTQIAASPLATDVDGSSLLEESGELLAEARSFIARLDALARER